MALASSIPECPVSKRRIRDGPGLAVAVTEAQSGTVRVHLIGRLEADTAAILTSSLAVLREGEPEYGVEIDLSALTFIDAAGLSVLGVNRLLLETAGWIVTSAFPRGAELHLLDCAAWAGWAPPQLTCTDILHWKPRTSPLVARSVAATRTVTGLARPARRGITRLMPFASGAAELFETRSVGTRGERYDDDGAGVA
jgi:ABC-type transporter Mla MlaB component